MFFFRELQTVNLRDVFGTEGKSDLGFFPFRYTSVTNTQTEEKILNKKQRIKVKSQRHVTLDIFF